ncbi:MAG: NADH-quinone oxidoreductase subunit N, partial [Planctomyces sp.]
MINYETLINQAAGLIIPEIILLATVCVMLLAAPFMVSETGVAPSGLRHRWGILVLLALSVATLTWFRTSPSTESVTSGPFRSDEFVWFIRGISLAAGFLLTLILWDQIDDAHAAEAHACLLAILCGVNFTAISNDLVTLFLGLELVSIPTYISLI